MSLVEVDNLSFDFGEKPLFKNASFRLLKEDHMGLVGLNGVGKTTFLKLLIKELSPDKGKIEWLPNIRYGYLDQHLQMDQDKTILSYLANLYAPLYQKEKQIEEIYNNLMSYSEKEQEKMLNKAYKLQEELNEEDFYSIDARIKGVCNGLGIDEYGLDRSISILSGGQKAKVVLAKLLLENPDVLIMDEPTNFLDVAQIDWLTKYLKNFPNAFIVVSHDVDFLNNICNVVTCIENNVFTRFKGNYDDFQEKNQFMKEEYEKLYNRQQKFIKKTQEYIDKNLVRATTTKMAQSRRKVLEKLDILEKPKTEKVLNFKFPYSKDIGKEILSVSNLTIGYDFPILENLNFEIKAKELIVFIGHNGVGKSTLLKTILDYIKPLSGSYKWADRLDINYFAQEEKYYDMNPIDYIRDHYPTKTDQEIRAVLAKFGIDSKLVFKSMLKLSGGEQTKVRLANMSLKKSNLLILDEPTNHLDPSTKDSLKVALLDYPGTILLVSHEKEFYEDIATRIINIKEKTKK